ncbi:hypothetical protein EIP86_003400 [Pleurotus ostreatoroseus]|nr:hypothetical protein EIP86_003400 [Pleurotus ostreatoroseus]
MPWSERGVSGSVVYDVQKVKLMMILLASKALSISQLVFGKKAVGSPLIAKISGVTYFKRQDQECQKEDEASTHFSILQREEHAETYDVNFAAVRPIGCTCLPSSRPSPASLRHVTNIEAEKIVKQEIGRLIVG